MGVTREEAVRVLAAADVAVRAPDEARLIVPRVVICQAVLTYCQSKTPVPLRWDTPLRELVGTGDEAGAKYRFVDYMFWWMDLEELQWEATPEQIAAAETFGDLVLLVENQVRAFWNQEAVTGCKTQALFYEMRRTLAAQPGARNSKPAPRRTLEDLLPGPDADAFCRLLEQRFGAREIPCSEKVFGVLLGGVTWFIGWVVALIVGFRLLANTPATPGWYIAYFFASALGIALLLGTVSRSTWDDVTLGHLTCRTLQQNAETTIAVRALFAAWTT